MPARSSGFRRAAIGAIALTAALAACSSGHQSAADPGSLAPTTTNAPTTTTYHPQRCQPPTTGPVRAVKDPSIASDSVVMSFDGTQIHVHWFPLATATTANPAPTVLMGPGWGSGGDTNTTTSGALGISSIKGLRAAGYNVLTWDPRGFGASTGTIEIDSAKAEARDVEFVIDWLATQPGVQLDGPRDPRIGMAGASYGGAIQLVTAAIDCRVDAIVPSWAWHSLSTSLDKADTVKSGWSTLLYGAAASRQLDPHIRSAEASGVTTGLLSAADHTWFADRGPGELVNNIHVPTLFVQGTVDTLFTLDEAVTNFGILGRNHIPTAMIWFCGGHGACLTPAGDRNRVQQRTLLWLDRWVKRDASVQTGPAFETVDQNGASFSAPAYPPPAGTPIKAFAQGTLTLNPDGGAGPTPPPVGNPDFLAPLVAPITPARATNAVNVDIVTPATSAHIVGAPTLRLTYTGTVPPGTRPTRVFAQLVDPSTGLVLGNQITPIAVVLDGAEHTTNVPLEMVAFTTKPGVHLTLQIVATTVAYATPRLGGKVQVDATLTLPVATNLTAR